jgi:hypothetical protein
MNNTTVNKYVGIESLTPVDYDNTSLFLVFLLDILFYCDDGSDKFLQNIGLSPNYMALQPREDCILDK